MNNIVAITIAGNSSLSSLSLSNNSFYNNSYNDSILCEVAPSSLYNQDNVFCGGTKSNLGNVISTLCGFTSTPPLEEYDSCKVCEGRNTAKDCEGVCFGNAMNCPPKRILYVNSTVGSGYNGCHEFIFDSIQDAIANASYGDTVIVLPGTYPGNISLLGKAITLTSEMGIPDYDNVTILCNPEENGLVIQSGESFDTVIIGLTITGCSLGGVYISNASAATFQNCSFYKNGYSSAINGGGMQVVYDSFVIINNSAFIGNEGEYGGGAFYISNKDLISVATISNTRFISNDANPSQGGGIYCNAMSKTTIESCYFIENKANPGYAIFQSGSQSRINIIGSSFYNSPGFTQAMIYCDGTASLNESENSFCGNTKNITYLHGCDVTPNFNITKQDSCLVCNGENKSMDCSGTCFGEKVSANQNGCCYSAQLDLCEVCNGDNSCLSCYPNCDICGENYCANGGTCQVCTEICSCIDSWTGTHCTINGNNTPPNFVGKATVTRAFSLSLSMFGFVLSLIYDRV